jgi:hypothetical protein
MPKKENEKEIRRVGAELKDRSAFPIESFDDLVEQLGGEDARVSYDGRRYRVRPFRGFVPRNYFPLISEGDFVDKAKDLDGHAERAKKAKKAERIG